jgi:hypothetical protein
VENHIVKCNLILKLKIPWTVKVVTHPIMMSHQIEASIGKLSSMKPEINFIILNMAAVRMQL